MAKRFEYINEVTVGSGGASTIEFTSIPQTYTDLKIVLSTRTTRGNVVTPVGLTINGSSDTYKSTFLLEGSGSMDSLGYNLTYAMIGYTSDSGSSTSTFGAFEVYIADYTTSNAKAIISKYAADNNSTNTGSNGILSIRSTNAAAVTSISFFESGGNTNFAQYSRATLYGIKNS